MRPSEIAPTASAPAVRLGLAAQRFIANSKRHWRFLEGFMLILPCLTQALRGRLCIVPFIFVELRFLHVNATSVFFEKIRHFVFLYIMVFFLGSVCLFLFSVFGVCVSTCACGGQRRVLQALPVPVPFSFLPSLLPPFLPPSRPPSLSF